MSPKIKVDLALVSAKPPLVALADAMIETEDLKITIRRCAVFERAGQSAWSTLPRIPVEKNGSRIYVNLLDLPPGLKQQILDKILEEFAAKRRATSSLGASGPRERAMSGLTTRDNVRQEAPGGSGLPGLDVKAAVKLSAGQGRRRRPHLI
jgi:hypothetical protein